MIIVLDASGAVEIALGNAHAQQFLQFLKKADVVLSPDIFVSEVTNVFWKYRQLGHLTDEVCLHGIEFCVHLIDDFVDSRELWREAYFEGVKNQTATYDMFYLIAARRNAGKIVSLDKKLNALAEKEELT